MMMNLIAAHGWIFPQTVNDMRSMATDITYISEQCKSSLFM